MASGPERRDRAPRRAFGLALLLCCLVVLVPAPTMSQQGRTIRLVALGDSLTAGFLLPDSAAFPSVLERALQARGRAVEVANAGVSGDTVAGGLQRLDVAVPDGTDGVILELGANDMLRGSDPAAIRAGLEQIIGRLAARGIPVLLAGVRATEARDPAYRARFDAIYPDLARRYRLTYYPDFYAGVGADPGFKIFDGVHPSAEGVRQIVARVLPSVETFLTRLRARTRRGAPR